MLGAGRLLTLFSPFITTQKKYLIFLHYKGTKIIANERMFSYKNKNFKFSFVNKD